MGFDPLDTFVLIFIATVLVVAIYMLFGFRKRKLLDSKVIEYEKLLRQTGHFRVIYLDAIKQTEEAKKRIDYIKEELASQRFRLVKQRSEVKKLLPEMHRIKRELPEGDQLVKKAFEQRKQSFRSQWALLNEMRKNFILAMADLPLINQKYIELMETEQKCTRKWQMLRSSVMALFNELHGQIELSSPREVLSGSRE